MVLFGLFISGRRISHHSLIKQLFTSIIHHLFRYVYINAKLLMLKTFIFTGARGILELLRIIVYNHTLRIDRATFWVKSSSLL